MPKRPPPDDFRLNEDGLLVATKAFLLRRGYCCGNGCLNCPYQTSYADKTPKPRCRNQPPATSVLPENSHT